MQKPSKPSSQDSIKAVTICKIGHLQYRVFELTIAGGKVVSKRALDRGAGDMLEIQASRAEEALWNFKGQTDDALSNIADAKDI